VPIASIVLRGTWYCTREAERSTKEKTLRRQEKILRKQRSGRWKAYLIGIGLVFGATIIGELLKTIPYFDPTNMDMLYLLCVVISAFYLGIGPSIMVLILSVPAFDFFFVLPLYTLAVANEQSAVNILLLFLVGIAIISLSPRIR